MAHYNTHTIDFDGKTIKIYTILNLTPEQLYVMNSMIQGSPIPDRLLEVAHDIKTKMSEMASEIKINEVND